MILCLGLKSQRLSAMSGVDSEIWYFSASRNQKFYQRRSWLLQDGPSQTFSKSPLLIVNFFGSENGVSLLISIDWVLKQLGYFYILMKAWNSDNGVKYLNIDKIKPSGDENGSQYRTNYTFFHIFSRCFERKGPTITMALVCFPPRRRRTVQSVTGHQSFWG